MYQRKFYSNWTDQKNCTLIWLLRFKYNIICGGYKSTFLHDFGFLSKCTAQQTN